MRKLRVRAIARNGRAFYFSFSMHFDDKTSFGNKEMKLPETVIKISR